MRRVRWAVVASLRERHLRADRTYNADRIVGEERYPDRRIRQGRNGKGPVDRECRVDWRAAAAATDSDDVVCVHLRADAALDCSGSRCYSTASDRYGDNRGDGVLERVRDLPDSDAVRNRGTSRTMVARRGTGESVHPGDPNARRDYARTRARVGRSLAVHKLELRRRFDEVARDLLDLRDQCCFRRGHVEVYNRDFLDAEIAIVLEVVERHRLHVRRYCYLDLGALAPGGFQKLLDLFDFRCGLGRADVKADPAVAIFSDTL